MFLLQEYVIINMFLFFNYRNLVKTGSTVGRRSNPAAVKRKRRRKSKDSSPLNLNQRADNSHLTLFINILPFSALFRIYDYVSWLDYKEYFTLSIFFKHFRRFYKSICSRSLEACQCVSLVQIRLILGTWLWQIWNNEIVY